MDTQVFRITFGIFLAMAFILPPSHTLENKTKPVKVNPTPVGTQVEVANESESKQVERLGKSNIDQQNSNTFQTLNKYFFK